MNPSDETETQGGGRTRDGQGLDGGVGLQRLRQREEPLVVAAVACSIEVRSNTGFWRGSTGAILRCV